MVKKRKISFQVEAAMEFLKQIAIDRPFYVLLVPLVTVLWAFERWVFSLTNWVPLAIAVWATFQYASHQHKVIVEDLNRTWKRTIFEASPTTPLEHSEWLNKLLMEVWPYSIHPKISLKFSQSVKRRLKQRKTKLIERLELEDFSLGSSPPSLGLQGMRWSTLRAERIMHTDFDWDTKDMSIKLLAKLAKPLYGTARIVINHLHVKGDLQLRPVLDGRAILLSFLSVPEVSLVVAFGSGASQLPGTALPGVSSWLVKILTDTLTKTMVEPRRRCLTLPAVQLGKTAVGGILYVTVISASQISRNGSKVSPPRRQQSYPANQVAEETLVKDLMTFVEVEVEDLSRRTEAKSGTSPQWDSTFNMVLHDDTGIIKFHLYESSPGTVKFDRLASCEVKIRYSEDDSTIFWAIGPDSSVLATRAEYCGKAVEMNIPFEGVDSGELLVRLVLKEWQFSDGSHSVSLNAGSQSSLYGLSGFQPKTGRKIYVTVVDAKDLGGKDRSAKSEPYVKLQYGKVVQRTRIAQQQSSNPVWNQVFEFEEIGGSEFLKLKCFYEETFGDEAIGSATVNLEGLTEGSVRNVPVPLEKASSGEVRLLIEAKDAREGSNGGSGNGWLELVLIEGRDLVAADLNGTSDPYVRIQYGNEKRRTKVVYKNLNPKWDQTFEFLDDGSQLELQVRDHNAILASSSIGNCIVEYQRLPPNETSDKWIPLQGVKKGEVHVQITRRVPELQKKASLDSDSLSIKAHTLSGQMKRLLIKLQSLANEEDLEEIVSTLTDLQSLEDEQEGYMLQLETERMLLLKKINELGQELFNSSSPAPHRRASH